jgi:hypothetical protein
MRPIAAQRHMPRRRAGAGRALLAPLDEDLAESVVLAAVGGDVETLAADRYGRGVAGLMDVYAVALSVGLQRRVLLVDLIREGLGMYFVPNGRTDDPEIPRVRSIVDYVARRLAIDWLPYDQRCELGVYTVDERMAQARAWMSAEDARLSNPDDRGCPDAFDWDLANSIGDPAAAAC